MFLRMAMAKHTANKSKSKIPPGNSAFHLLWKFFSFQLCALCLLAGTGKPSKSSDARQNLFDDLRLEFAIRSFGDLDQIKILDRVVIDVEPEIAAQ